MYKKWLVLLLLVFPWACFCQKAKPVECDIFYMMITSNDSAMVMDVREIESYQKERIINAHWAGSKDSFTPLLMDMNKETAIFLYCEIGKRSKECSKWLKSLGYKNVYELKGGVREWKENGYPMDSTVIKNTKDE